MLDGFKKFVLRGNVVDMAVGVVVGARFRLMRAGARTAQSPRWRWQHKTRRSER